VNVEYVKNSDVARVLVGVPKNHKHLRLIIELADGRIFIFSEATVANIARAYTCIKTHPIKRAVELKNVDLSSCPALKEGYSKYQLIETNRCESEVAEEIAKIIESSR